MDFEYTNISNITLNQVLNEKVSIYDYLTPKIDAAKRLIYKSNNEDIVTMGDDGTIIPQELQQFTLKVYMMGISKMSQLVLLMFLIILLLLMLMVVQD